MSSDADKNSRNREKHLAGAVQKYPTPTNSMMTVQDMEQARFAGNDPQRPKYGEIFPTALADAVSFWPAPRTAGMCGGTGNWAQLKKNAASIEEARQMGAGNGGQLNPGWEERLMGYPDGWTDVERENIDTENRYPGAWADGSWDTIPRVATRVKNRVNRIKCLGNAVVPQIPMIIFSLPVFDVFRKGAPL
jgi:hypothetical protein